MSKRHERPAPPAAAPSSDAAPPPAAHAGPPAAPGSDPLPKLGLGLLAGLVLAWGFNWPMTKISLIDIPPWTHRAYMCMLGGLGLLIVCRAIGAPWRVPRRVWPMLCLAAFLNVTAWQVPIAYAILMLKAGQAAVLAFTMPLWAVIIGIVFLKEPIVLHRLAALALGMAGLGVLFLEGSGGETHVDGIVLILLAALCWAVGVIVMKRTHWGVPATTLATWQLIIGGTPTVIIAILLEGLDITGAGGRALLALAYTITFATVFAYYAWFRLIELLPTNVFSVGTLLVPVLGMVTSWLIIDEPITQGDAMAAVLIISAVSLVLFGPSLRRAKAR